MSNILPDTFPFLLLVPPKSPAISLLVPWFINGCRTSSSTKNN